MPTVCQGLFLILVAQNTSLPLHIANILNIGKNMVSIKATTYEKKGPIGSSEGIACEAYVLIKKINN